MSAKFGFQSLSTATESTDSVSSVVDRSMHGCPMAAIHRWRPCLSAPTPPLGCHDAPWAAADLHSPSSALSSLRSLPRRAPPRVSDSARALLLVSGQASLPKALPVPPSPRRHLRCHCRARVRQHCRAPSGFTLAGVPPCSPATWLGLSAPPFPSIFFLELPLDSLMLGVNFNWVGIGWARRRTTRSAAEPPFTPANPLELGRVRVSYLVRSALGRGSRLCPWIQPRPCSRWVSPAMSSPLSLCHCRAGPTDRGSLCQPLSLCPSISVFGRFNAVLENS